MSQKHFRIDDSILATHQQRANNFFLDLVMHYCILFGICMIVVVIMTVNGYSQDEIFEQAKSVSKLTEFTIALIIDLIYFNCFEILFARTIGKFITKTVVVDEYGRKPTINAILMRSICRAIPFEFLTFLGMPCRGWHDQFSNTYVVQQALLDSKRRDYNAFQANQHPTPNT